MLARGIRLAALDTAALAGPRAPARPRPADAGRRARRRLPAADAVRRRAGLDRDALLAAIRPQLERFFGKRGERVVDANLTSSPPPTTASST